MTPPPPPGIDDHRDLLTHPEPSASSEGFVAEQLLARTGVSDAIDGLDIDRYPIASSVGASGAVGLLTDVIA